MDEGSRSAHGRQVYFQVIIAFSRYFQVAGSTICIQIIQGSAVIGASPVRLTCKLEDIGQHNKPFIKPFAVSVQNGSRSRIPTLVVTGYVQFFRETGINEVDGIRVVVYIQYYLVFSFLTVKDQVVTNGKAYVVQRFSTG